MEPASKEDLLVLEARVREAFATRAEVDAVKTDLHLNALDMAQVKVELVGIRKEITGIASNLTWFTRTALGAIVLGTLAMLFAR